MELSVQQMKELSEHDYLVERNKELMKNGITIYNILETLLENDKKSIDDASANDLKVFIKNIKPECDLGGYSRVSLLKKLKVLLKKLEYKGLMNTFDIMIFSRHFVNNNVPKDLIPQMIEAMKDEYYLRFISNYITSEDEYKSIAKYLYLKRLK
jgi:hypothetical protein